MPPLIVRLASIVSVPPAPSAIVPVVFATLSKSAIVPPVIAVSVPRLVTMLPVWMVMAPKFCASISPPALFVSVEASNVIVPPDSVSPDCESRLDAAVSPAEIMPVLTTIIPRSKVIDPLPRAPPSATTTPSLYSALVSLTLPSVMVPPSKTMAPPFCAAMTAPASFQVTACSKNT